MLLRKIRSWWLFYTSVASGGVLWDKTWRGANFYLSWACLLVCITSFPLCQNDWQEREWRMSDPNIAGDGFMQKLNSVCKFLWFVLSSGFLRKKYQTNQPCFAGAIYLGGSSSGLVTIVASFAVGFGLGWDLMAGQGVRGGRSFSEAPSGRNLHSSNLRWGSDVLFPAKQVAFKARGGKCTFRQPTFLGNLPSGFLWWSLHQSPYGCGLVGCIKRQKRKIRSICPPSR